MSANCCDSACSTRPHAGARYRRILWLALWANAVMAAVEIAGGLASGSVSLLADAIDFAGDAANYGLSLAVLSMGLIWRARAAWIKGFSMAAYGLLVLGRTAWAALSGATPQAVTMGSIALLALAVNIGVAILLFTYREGDANMRSVWLCSRNDAIANAAVMLAAAGVFGTGQRWPDLLVAIGIASLALAGGLSVLRRARGELRQARTHDAPADERDTARG